MVDPAGNSSGAVDFLACGRLDNVLPEFAHQDRTAAQFGLLAQNLKDIALCCGRIKAEQKIGGGKMEEMQDVTLHDLPVVHQAAHFFRRRRQFVDAADHVHSLGSGQVVADRADTTEALDDNGNFPQEPPLDKPFEPAKFDDVQACFVNNPVLIKVNRHLAVPFDAGDGRYFNGARCISQSGYSPSRTL